MLTMHCFYVQMFFDIDISFSIKDYVTNCWPMFAFFSPIASLRVSFMSNERVGKKPPL
jgi:hypothetical protein